MTVWAVQVFRDGEPVTGRIPTDPYAAADPFAEFLFWAFGRTVAVGPAVHAYLENEKQTETLFGHYEKECA